ncbi:UDP-glucose 4-epimerase GalE [Leifsonia sp. NPDC058292]|uniref:UDP-glucose 4-epimerase GalE n=1 Tax=Leifsonia sp. NPDC058292 TaxID=3346428 RepID=UPI0036DD1C3B
MRVLVTGGAGYIGAHVVRLLQERGDDVVIADDLVTGDVRRVPGVEVLTVDLASLDAIDVLSAGLREQRIDAVLHFAARKQVGESVERPAWYYQQNVGGLANLLIAMENAGVARLVFSSSAAVYGSASGAAITEDAQTVPVNPYGGTKLVGEQLVADAGRAFGLSAVSLRYFNVAGTGAIELADRARLNLVPMVFERIDQGLPPLIFGDDYDTPDGTCVRDYVHVLDVAEAHLAAIDHTVGGRGDHEVFNIGTGEGTSVRQMVDAILELAGSSLEPEVVERRAGDAAVVVASASKIEAELGWRAAHGLDEIVGSAWRAHVAARVDGRMP